MKRSKVFLGVTTAILAVAGVAAAKHYGPPKTRLYLTHGLTACLQQTGITCTTGGSNPCLFKTTNGSFIQIYTDGPAGVYHPANPTNCKSALQYPSEP